MGNKISIEQLFIILTNFMYIYSTQSAFYLSLSLGHSNNFHGRVTELLPQYFGFIGYEDLRVEELLSLWDSSDTGEKGVIERSQRWGLWI